MKRRLGFSTRAIHGDPETRPDWAPVVAPLFQSATFTNPIGSAAEVLYTRYGNNPNQIAIAKRLAALEGAEAAIFVASGMGAAARRPPAVERVDLRGRAPVVRSGIRPPGDRRVIRHPARVAHLEAGPEEDDPGDLRRDAHQPVAARDRPRADRCAVQDG